jgi:histidine ammonia-lyase
MRKKRRIDTSEMSEFNKRMIREHSVGQGPPLPQDVTRASAILLLNTIAGAHAYIRPEVAVQIANRLSKGPPLSPIPMYGTTGIGDVVSMAHLASDLLGDMNPAPGEALPLIAQSSVVTAQAALAMYDLSQLLDTLTTVAVFDIEAFSATPFPYHTAVGEVRPYPGYQQALRDINSLLQGSELMTRTPRHLQSPLSFRSAASVLGSAREGYAYCEQQVSREMNYHQQNPLAWPAEDRMIPTSNFDMQILATAMDFARLTLAPCITAQNERSMKLLQASQTGLTDGLEPKGDNMGHGLSEMTWPLQAMAVEVRLLAQPVSIEIASSTQAEGIEDRVTMAGLAARKLSDMIQLVYRVLAISVVIACQAIDLRRSGGWCSADAEGNTPTAEAMTELHARREEASKGVGVYHLSVRMERLHAKVRSLVPMMREGDSPPLTLEPLVEALKQGLLNNNTCDEER